MWLSVVRAPASLPALLTRMERAEVERLRYRGGAATSGSRDGSPRAACWGGGWVRARVTSAWWRIRRARRA